MEMIDMKLICRLCAREGEFCIQVFGEDGVRNKIPKKIRLCLPITIKEDDKFPKQICLSCLNKLDTSYELYSGSLNAENTIKRLLKDCNQTGSAEDNLPVETSIKQGQNDRDVMVQQQLSWSRPCIKFGKTVVKLRDVSNKRRSNEHESEQKPKVKRSESERHDSLILEPSSNDSTGISCQLPSASLDDESTNTPQQVSKLGPPAEDLSAYNVALSNQMCVAGNVGAAASEQELFETSDLVSEASSVGQLVGSIPTSTEAKILGTVSTSPDVGIQTVSTSLSGVAVTLKELSGTSNQDVLSSAANSAVPVIIEQSVQSTGRQPLVSIPESIYKLSAGKEDSLIADSLNSVNQLQQNMVEDNLQEIGHEHLQNQASQNDQAKWHMQFSSPEKGETTVLGPTNVLIITSSNGLPPHQQGAFSQNTVLQLPVEARQILHVSPTGNANTCQIYVSDAIQNSTSVDVKRQVSDLESEHQSSSAYPVKAEGVSSDTVTATTNAMARIPMTGGGISLGAPTALATVTPTAASLMGIGLDTPSPAVVTSNSNNGGPTVSEIGIITPVSSYTLNLLTATVSASPMSMVTSTATSAFSTVTSTASSTDSTPVSDSLSTAGTGISSTLITVREGTPDVCLITEEPSRDTDVVTVSSPTVSSTVGTRNQTGNNVTEDSAGNRCPYCCQIFPADIIMHHRKLHLKQRFFSCLTCGKNFRTEVGLDNHRCEASAD